MNSIEKSNKIIVFQMDNEKYGLEIEFVRSIEKMTEITPVPQVNEFILGVMNLRGTIIPLLDLKKRLGRGKTELGESTRILIVADGGAEVGLVVDEANDVLDLKEEIIESPFSSSGENYIKGIARMDTLIVLLNLKTILDMDELIVLNIHEDEGKEGEHNDNGNGNR